MEIKLHHSTRGIWIFIDGKHKKTVPKHYANCVLENLKKLNLDKKHLQPNEKEMLDQFLFKTVFKSFIKTLKTKEKRVFELVAKAKPIGVRKVINPHKNREELVFDNNLKVKIPYSLYAKHPVKLPTVHLNY